MAELTAPTTRLEAVNDIIASVGEMPATSLDSPSRLAVINGENVLNRTSRLVQAKGWAWNTEQEVQLSVDGSGFLNLASNVLSAKVSKSAWTSVTRDYVFRDQRMYNRADQTYVFDAGTTLLVDQILLRPYEELPECARQYIWARAGVIYQARYLTGDALFRFTESMALAAYAEMLNDETRVERYNLDDSGALRDLCNRR